MKFHTPTLHATCSIALALLFSACGPSSGVPGNRKLNDLEDGDAAKLCRFTGEMVRETFTSRSFQRASCSVEGFIAELLPLSTRRCEEERDRCLDAITDPEPIDDAACDELEGAYLPGCEASVAEYEDCLRALEDRVRSAARELSCDNLRKGTVDSGALQDIFDVRECAQLSESCLAGVESEV